MIMDCIDWSDVFFTTISPQNVFTIQPIPHMRFCGLSSAFVIFALCFFAMVLGNGFFFFFNWLLIQKKSNVFHPHPFECYLNTLVSFSYHPTGKQINVILPLGCLVSRWTLASFFQKWTDVNGIYCIVKLRGEGVKGKICSAQTQIGRQDGGLGR